ncbi:hypothetical protein BABINDRAFT_163818 [Babjeviella inositovora NRRL Y-12698]|uniref:pH-response regulator protein palH/RIM21 n=1 Tax=Babjeviella inositovora NRRL Y-12698 TaxID=984486 RepID=A0A1E3QH98_9ASCO|nr:uncharacterized protein BABINDRAFT_163818 [Babjeviella inositovora NRRL Y-12698]ODQ77083.1 hypothetical protein BABINDRAFT_163818 [Babjeviella inositovora NRRL Y-12698]
MRLFKRQIPWRNSEDLTHYASCDILDLPAGILISQDPYILTSFPEGTAKYQPRCYNGIPLLPAMRKLPYKTFPIITADWANYTSTDGGRFGYSIYPIIFSISTCTTLTVFLTVMVFTNYTRNPSMLLKSALLGASCYVLMCFIIAIRKLNEQHNLGYLSSDMLVDFYSSNIALSVIDLISVVLLQISQVQIVMRLFNRQKDKRIAFFAGVTLSLCSQVIWAVSQFGDGSETTLVILPAFIYLLRIAMSILYLGLVMVYIFLKRQFVFQKSLALLTVVVFIVVNLSIVLFVSDMANFWVSSLSEIFNVACYVASIVIPWEWINLINSLEKVKEKDGILGREIYEEEMVADEMSHNYNESIETAKERKNISAGSVTASSNTTDVSIGVGRLSDLQANPGVPEKVHTRFRIDSVYQISNRVVDTLRNATDKVLHVTDQVIAHGFSVPRADSANSQRSRNAAAPPATGGVFVYAAREASFDNDEDSVDQTSSHTLS